MIHLKLGSHSQVRLSQNSRQYASPGSTVTHIAYHSNTEHCFLFANQHSHSKNPYHSIHNIFHACIYGSKGKEKGGENPRTWEYSRMCQSA